MQTTLNILRVQGGAAGVTYGNLLTLPVAGGLLYVEPVYVKASAGQGSYPLLQKVLVSYGDKIGFQNTYAGAIASLVSAAGGSPGQGSTGGPSASPPASGSPSAVGVRESTSGLVGPGTGDRRRPEGLQRRSGRAQERRFRGLRARPAASRQRACGRCRGVRREQFAQCFAVAFGGVRLGQSEPVAVGAGREDLWHLRRYRKVTGPTRGGAAR